MSPVIADPRPLKLLNEQEVPRQQTRAYSTETWEMEKARFSHFPDTRYRYVGIDSRYECRGGGYRTC